MKIDNKGFTLIELLAVVVIMLAISIMAVSSISAAIERNKKKETTSKIKIIQSYAEVYYNDHINSLDGKSCFSLDELDLSDKESKDADGEYFNGCISLGTDDFLQYREENCDCN